MVRVVVVVIVFRTSNKSVKAINILGLELDTYSGADPWLLWQDMLKSCDRLVTFEKIKM